MSQNPSAVALRRASTLVGPVIAALVAWGLSLTNDGGASGVTQANVGLAMAVVTVAFATIDWVAGVTTSIVAALTLNFFHTQPYHTLRITDRRDVYSVLLLGALGLAVSAVTAARVRRGVTQLRRLDARRAGEELEGRLAHDRSASEVWIDSISACGNDLTLVMARLEPSEPGALPRIGRFTDHPDSQMVSLPAVGAALQLVHRNSVGRWLILTPSVGMGPLEIDRRALFAFADALELALDPPTQEKSGSRTSPAELGQ